MEIQVFNHELFGAIRVINRDGEPWFVGKDVAQVLGYKLPQKAILEHVETEDRKTLAFKAFSKTEKASLWQNNDYSNKTIINESGLYSLILSSKLPKAKEFKHWVTSVVLPQIRKTGGYIPVKEEDDDKTILCKALMIYKRTIEEKDALIEQQRPKVEYCDDVLMSEDCVTTTQVAKQFGLSAIALNNKLHELGIQFKQSRQWFLYAKYAKMGLAKERTAPYFDSDGNARTAITMVWTETGKRFLSELIRSDYNVKEAMKTLTPALQ